MSRSGSTVVKFERPHHASTERPTVCLTSSEVNAVLKFEVAANNQPATVGDALAVEAHKRSKSTGFKSQAKKRLGVTLVISLFALIPLYFEHRSPAAEASPSASGEFLGFAEESSLSQDQESDMYTLGTWRHDVFYYPVPTKSFTENKFCRGLKRAVGCDEEPYHPRIEAMKVWGYNLPNMPQDRKYTTRYTQSSISRANF